MRRQARGSVFGPVRAMEIIVIINVVIIINFIIIVVIVVITFIIIFSYFYSSSSSSFPPSPLFGHPPFFSLTDPTDLTYLTLLTA